MPAPRWAVLAAHLVPLATLPSGLWRIGLALGFSMGMLDNGVPIELPPGERVYVVGLSLVIEALALLTLGLVRPWGERVPRWLPLIGGREVRPYAAIVPAALGALALAVIWGVAFRDFPSPPEMEIAGAVWHAVFVAVYLPLLLWAPLLGVVTYSYYRRRCRPQS